jgi:hypothetical protein
MQRTGNGRFPVNPFVAPVNTSSYWRLAQAEIPVYEKAVSQAVSALIRTILSPPLRVTCPAVTLANPFPWMA